MFFEEAQTGGRMRLCILMAVEIAVLTGADLPAADGSRFRSEYPTASIPLRNVTSNVKISGSMTTADYEGHVVFSRLVHDGTWSMKQFEARKTTLSWHRRVESFSRDWFYLLDAKSGVNEYEFKGADFPKTLPEIDALRIEFRRWLRCDKFSCSLHNVYGVEVAALLDRQDFSIESEGPVGSDGLYEVLFKVKSWSPLLNGRFLAGRMQFDEKKSWALITYDLMYELPGSNVVDYVMGRNTVGEWQDGHILPITAEVRAGGPVKGKDTPLGVPEWPGNESIEALTVTSVETGHVKTIDFLPSAFGLPDHLVLGTASKETSSTTSIWLASLAVLNGITLVWWIIRRRNEIKRS